VDTAYPRAQKCSPVKFRSLPHKQAIALVSLVEPVAYLKSELAQLHSLMLKCWDRPMDFADATLVHLANRESLSAILTIDQADFATYRLAGKKRFHVLPIDQP